MFKKVLFILFLAIYIPVKVVAQNASGNQTPVINQQIWIDFYPHYYRTDKLEYYGDTGYRTMINKNSWSRVYVRPSIRYHQSEKWEFQGGFGFFYIFNISNIDQFEFRPWQGVQFNGPSFRRWSFKNSLKLEERWSFLTDTWNTNFEFRLRFKVSGKVSLTDKWAIPFYGEAFMPLTGKIDELFQNQGRAGVGLSYKANKDWKFAFLMNWQRSKAGQGEEVNVSDYVYQIKIIKNWKRIIHK